MLQEMKQVTSVPTAFILLILIFLHRANVAL